MSPLTEQQERTMAMIMHSGDGVTSMDLSRDLGIHRTVVAKRLKSLAKKGFITSRRASGNRIKWFVRKRERS